jgi:hypothetical protein
MNNDPLPKTTKALEDFWKDVEKSRAWDIRLMFGTMIIFAVIIIRIVYVLIRDGGLYV